MEDYSNLQGWTVLEVLFALLLTLVTAYVYLSCRSHARHTEVAPAKPVAASPSILRTISLAERENTRPALVRPSAVAETQILNQRLAGSADRVVGGHLEPVGRGRHVARRELGGGGPYVRVTCK